MDLEFKYSEMNLKQMDIMKFQDSIKFQIPPDFIAFYLKHNGGIPNKTFINEYKIVYFNPITYGSEKSIEKTNERLRDVLPEGFIPFCSIGNGWPFCIDLNHGKTYGHIYFCGMDGDEPILIADNFTDFINLLSVEYI